MGRNSGINFEGFVSVCGSYVVVDVADDVGEEDKDFQKNILDVVAKAMEAPLRRHLEDLSTMIQ